MLSTVASGVGKFLSRGMVGIAMQPLLGEDGGSWASD